MKKVLIASTALVAAGMLSAGAASASEKIKLNLGGYSKWWVVGAQQKGAWKASQSNYQPIAVDVKGDNEVYFGGKTTLDNGLEVGIDVQLEAGGHTDARANTGANTDVIDESYVYVAGGFGKLIIGSKNNGTYLIHNTAPDAAGNWNEGGILSGGFAIATPNNSSQATAAGANSVHSIGEAALVLSTSTYTAGTGNTTAILTDGDSEGVTYVSPTFYGFTFGASYKPNGLSEDTRGVETASMPVYGAGILYTGTIGGVGVKADVGYAQYDASRASAALADVGAHGIQREISTGAQLSYAGFTLGGSYRQVIDNVNATAPAGTGAAVSFDAKAWDIGLQYASGPYAVSVSYFQSKAEGLISNSNQDTIEIYQVSGKYNLGAGVDVLATIGHAKFEDEAKAAAGVNEGWAAMTGLSLAF